MDIPEILCEKIEDDFRNYDPSRFSGFAFI